MKTMKTILFLAIFQWTTGGSLAAFSESDKQESSVDGTTSWKKVRQLGKDKYYKYKPAPKPTNKPTNSPTGSPTLSPTNKPTPHPTPKPTMQPTPHPTFKPTSKPTTAAPTAKPSAAPTYQCRDVVFKVHQWWDQTAISASGAKVSINDASKHIGLKWTYVGDVYDAHDKFEVGKGIEQRDLVDKEAIFWHGEGTYIDLYGCKGLLAFSGYFDDEKDVGYYVIEGGTGVFKGATGYIVEEHHKFTGYSFRKIKIS